eukprot:PhF_6_TR1054/c0_g1_i5/m.2194
MFQKLAEKRAELTQKVSTTFLSPTKHADPFAGTETATTTTTTDPHQQQQQEGHDTTTTSFDQPQWGSGSAATTSSTNPVPLPRAPCALCSKRFEQCTCTACNRCGGRITLGGIGISRHHCRICFLPVCGSCSGRTRQLMVGVGNYAQERCCDHCAIREGLTHVFRVLTTSRDSTSTGTTEGSSSIELYDFQHVGLMLLMEVTALPRRCCDEVKCDHLTYRPTCTRCGLPTIAMEPYGDRAVVIKDAANDATRRTQTVDKRAKELHETKMPSSVEDNLLLVASLRTVTPVIPRFHEKMDQNVKLLLGMVCAGLCYEYAGFPNITLREHVFPYTRHLRLVRTSQLVSVFEGPGKVRFVAFPGTHDARTGITDVKYFRTEQTIVRRVNGDGLGLHNGLTTTARYKVHTGFLEEANKVYMVDEVSKWVEEEGYEIVYCGHSLGGAIATLATVRMLNDHVDLIRGRFCCVTAGAPMVGCHNLRDLVTSYHWSDVMHHFVYRGDVVPRLLMGREAPTKVIKAAHTTLTATKDTLAAVHTKIATTALNAKAKIHERAGQVKDKIGGLFGKKKEEQPAEGGVDVEEDGAVEGDEPNASQGSGGGGEEVCVIPEPIPSKRSFEYFGTYHMLNVNGVPYKRSNDSEEVYDHLAQGLTKCTPLDHFMDTYAKAIVRHGMAGNLAYL